jgi:hypothetical protein
VFSLAIWIEACSLPREVWAAANHRRTLWLIYLFLPPMSWLYLVAVRPRLHKARRRLEANGLPPGVSVSWPSS